MVQRAKIETPPPSITVYCINDFQKEQIQNDAKSEGRKTSSFMLWLYRLWKTNQLSPSKGASE